MGESDAPTVYYPPPSKNEQALQAMQLRQLQEADTLQSSLEPFQLETAGLMKDPATGNLRKMTSDEYYASLTPLEQESYDITRTANARQLSAMRGELPIPADVQKYLDVNRRAYNQKMTNQLGPGWESSTPGMQSEAGQSESEAAILDSVRRGEMTGMEAIGSSQQDRLLNQVGAFLSSAQNPVNQFLTGAGADISPISQYAQNRATAGEFSAARAKMQNDRDIAKAQQMSGSADPCCFIMAEAGDLTDRVRAVRDLHFSPQSFVAIGYRSMARWLVPLMQKSPMVYFLVKYAVTHPIALLCEKENALLKIVANIWVGVWNLYGRSRILSPLR